MLPLSQLQPRILDKEKKKSIQKYTKHADDAMCALDVLEYDPKVSAAVEFVFGNVIVCKNSTIAKVRLSTFFL